VNVSTASARWNRVSRRPLADILDELRTARTLAFEEHGPGIVAMAVNRPDRANSQTVEMFGEIAWAAATLRNAPLRALIVTGAGGRAFCTGFDLDEVEIITKLSVAEFTDLVETAAAGSTGLRALPYPVIAAISGPAAGGGLSLLSAIGLLFMLPESIRFLASKGREPETIARILQRLAPGIALPANPHFVVADEEGSGKTFKVKLLFKDELRTITPLLWIAYIFSSMTAFFLATWTPLVFEALGFSRSTAALAATVNSAFGAIGGLTLMRFTDRFGAIAITVMPLLAVPLLLVTGFVDFGETGFLVASAFITLFLIGGHFGLHSIAGIFYPSTFRGNGAGWATSVAKIGSIAGPYIAGLILATSLPVRNIFAVLAICPAVFVVCILIIGIMHRRILKREDALAADGIALGSGAVASGSAVPAAASS